jgi:hypothetical protein
MIMICINLTYDIVKVEIVMKQIIVTKYLKSYILIANSIHQPASSTAGPCLVSLTMHYYGVCKNRCRKNR